MVAVTTADAGIVEVLKVEKLRPLGNRNCWYTAVTYQLDVHITLEDTNRWRYTLIGVVRVMTLVIVVNLFYGFSTSRFAW